MEAALLTQSAAIPARPYAVAEAGNIPLGLAKVLLLKGVFTTASAGDGSLYVYRDNVIEAVTAYLAELDIDPRLEELNLSPRPNPGIPVLPAWLDDNGGLVVYCRWCRAIHKHGSGEGTRIPHCEWPSPWKKIGSYTLQVVGSWEEGRTYIPREPYPR